MTENNIGNPGGFDNTELSEIKIPAPENVEGQENLEQARIYDVAIVLGCGTRADSEGNMISLSVDSKLRTISAGLLASRGKVKELIFTGGRTAGPENPSEAELMKAYAIKKFPELENFPIIVEDSSVDTSENARLVAELLGDEFEGSVLLVTNDYHMLRATRNFEHQGLSVEEMPAESVITESSPERHTSDGKLLPDHREAFIQKYLRSCDMKKKRAIEVVLRGIMKVDPDGKILTAIAARLRGGKELNDTE